MTDEEREMIRGWLIDYATLDERRGYVLTYPQLVHRLWGLVKRDPAPEVVLVDATGVERGQELLNRDFLPGHGGAEAEVVLVEAPEGQTLEEWQEEMAELRRRAREA
tara:strand:+ start:3221 stop:3541 length:321 start_codon:yes stop_codon:yes gene_type:complete